MTKILHLDSSARSDASITRQMSRAAVDDLKGDVTYRDLADGLPFIDEAWIGAAYTPKSDRTPDQNAALAVSDGLVAELQEADTIVLGVPLYNFSVPASVKAWIDQVARANLTFRYTENGPVGLLNNKRVIVVMASGGVTLGGAGDFATDYLRHVLGFIGLTDVTFITPADVAEAA